MEVSGNNCHIVTVVTNKKNEGDRFMVYPPRLLMLPSDVSQGTEGSWCIAGWRD